jgi:hypothetical protein
MSVESVVPDERVGGLGVETLELRKANESRVEE